MTNRSLINFTLYELEQARRNRDPRYNEMKKKYWEWRKKVKAEDKKIFTRQYHKKHRFLNRDAIKKKERAWREKNKFKLKVLRKFKKVGIELVFYCSYCGETIEEEYAYLKKYHKKCRVKKANETYRDKNKTK